MYFIDTHAHIYGEPYEDDIEQVMTRAREAGCRAVFLPSTDLESARQCCAVAQKFPRFAFPMIGLHPEDLPPDPSPALQSIQRQLEGNHPFIAVGEIGLDYYWDDSHRLLQLEVFKQQLQIAHQHDLPVMIHSRRAHQDLLSVMREFKPAGLTGVFHCFGGSVGKARELLEFTGFCLGIGGTLTFKKSVLPEVLREGVPLSRIVLETDSPYMAPVPVRGTRNEPSNVRYVVEKLAEVYGVSPEEVAKQTTLNAQSIFKRARLL